MWKAALVMLIAFVAFVGTTLEWGSTLDGRSDPCGRDPQLCEDLDDASTTSSTTSTTTPTTAPATTAAPPTQP